ncbi:10447_t:CDS:2, partial [Acaulospora colombiana]
GMDEQVETFEDYYDSFDPDTYSHIESSSKEPYSYLVDGDRSYHESKSLESFSSPSLSAPLHEGPFQSYNENTHPFHSGGAVSDTNHVSTLALTPSRLTNLNLNPTFTPRRDLRHSYVKDIQPACVRKAFHGCSPLTNTRIITRNFGDAAYRLLFSFAQFNAVQSACYSSIIEEDENMVISAPTGSGKTVLFELAIVKMLIDDNSSDSKLCVLKSIENGQGNSRLREPN